MVFSLHVQTLTTNGFYILLGDLIWEPTESAVFCEIYSFKDQITDKTCSKNPLKPVCIDLVITDQKAFKVL